MTDSENWYSNSVEILISSVQITLPEPNKSPPEIYFYLFLFRNAAWLTIMWGL